MLSGQLAETNELCLHSGVLVQAFQMSGFRSSEPITFGLQARLSYLWVTLRGRAAIAGVFCVLQIATASSQTAFAVYSQNYPKSILASVKGATPEKGLHFSAGVFPGVGQLLHRQRPRLLG
jgi:hypothetical protein